MTGGQRSIEEALAGTYAFERELGRGGMATVYLVHDRKHDRRVALKVLLPQLAQALGTERFLREIRTAARLQHPHILGVIDSGEAAGQLWFTMPFVDGESLRDRLKREGRLPVDEALRITREAARALDYAHAQGVVHRDIKPENILLTRDGSTLVADFGIARSTGADADALTQTGFVLGTPAYMSPEQAVGDKAIDGRSDVYALAAVLYEMLVGAPPFTGENAQAIIMKRFSEPPPSARSARPEVPVALDATIRRGLAAVAAERFGTAGEFARALGDATTPASGLPAAPRAHPLRNAMLPALLLGLVVGSGVLYAWRRGTDRGAPRAESVRQTASAPRAVRVAVLPFDNRGDSSDAYFADGMADAIRGKLTEIDGLEVIARLSSEAYAGSTKSLAQIASELGVDYLLTGTVRFAPMADGTSRVQVSPELVYVGDGVARSRWQQPFDAPMTDVFQVQASIAAKVASALDVAVGPGKASALGRPPTTNMEAYTAYLKGQAEPWSAEGSFERRLAYYEEAVAKDSGFTAAWAWLAILYANVGPNDSAIQRSRTALARAVALDSTTREVYAARMKVEWLVNRDSLRALAIAREGASRYPSDAFLLTSAGDIEGSFGRREDGIALLQRAANLDPLSYWAWRYLGNHLFEAGRHDEARTAYQQALVLDPVSVPAARMLVVNNFLDGGGPARARSDAAPVLSGPNGDIFAMTLALSVDLYWLLTPEQQDRLLRMAPAGFNGDSGGRALVFAEIYAQRGEVTKARAWGDSAARYYASAGEREPERSSRALSLAYAGDTRGALALARRAIANPPPGKPDAFSLVVLARIHAMRREPALAVDVIRQARTNPQEFMVTPAWLGNDPAFDPIRGDQGFDALTR